MSNDKELEQYTMEQYRTANRNDRKRYWLAVYRQRANAALNEMRKELLKMQQAARAHDVVRTKKMKTDKTTFIQTYSLHNPHKECPQCEKIKSLCSNVQSYKWTARKWMTIEKKKAKELW